ncbi:MAG TPA: GxxExxY protein [Chloroflexi bacterium]|nr:GxxExxY protein [Chloroflexota bacterium]
MKSGIGGRIQREYGGLTYRIIGSAMRVHRTLGPGLPERIYQRALAVEFGRQGIRFEREKPVEVFYAGVSVGTFYLDFLVEDRVIVELKALDQISNDHYHQVISYLTALGREVALLINFGTASLEYKRVLPPLAVQNSDAYRARVEAWRAGRRQCFDTD